MRRNLENDMRRALGLALVIYSSAAIADPVVLVPNDGYSALKGDFIRVKNDFRGVRTSVGVVSIPMAEVSCEGQGCPAAAAGESAGRSEEAETELTREQKDALFRKFPEWGRNDTGAH